MISLLDLGVVRGNVTPAVAENNMRIIFDALLDDTSDNIAVDVKGPIFLAPYTDPNNVTHVTLDGNPPPSQIPFRGNRAIKCLTFDYGASLATHPLAGTNINLVNVQIEADEKAFLFETNEGETNINVTQIFNTVVSVCWFGAVAQNAPNPAIAPDSYLAFMAAIRCFQRQPITNNVQWNFTVRVPATVGNASVYVIRQMIIIDSNVSIIGDGKVKTYLTFFNTSGFLIVGIQVGFNSGGQSTIANLNINCSLNTPRTLDRHGIIVNSTTNIIDVHIQGFDGDGIHFDTSGDSGIGNLSRFINVTCMSNTRNGVFVTGDDSNNILFEHVSARDNGACGFREQFSLQNTFNNCSAEANSLTANNQSRVRFNGNYYICIQDHTNITPLNTNFWRPFGAGPLTPVYPEWDSTRNYLMSFGFALCVSGNASRSVLTGCYAENNQLTLYNNPSTANGNIIIGGQINATNVSGFIYNENGRITTTQFNAKAIASTPTDPSPEYRIAGNLESDSLSDDGGFSIVMRNLKTNPLDAGIGRLSSLNLQYLRDKNAFGFRQSSSPSGNSMFFALRETVERAPNSFGVRNFALNDTYPTFQRPIFMRFRTPQILDNYRILGFTYQNPQTLGFLNEGVTFKKDDHFFNGNRTATNRAIGWRCIVDPDTNFPNGQWEIFHYFQPAAPSADTAPTPTDPEVLAVFTELRDLKAKMRAAGILEV